MFSRKPPFGYMRARLSFTANTIPSRTRLEESHGKSHIVRLHRGHKYLIHEEYVTFVEGVATKAEQKIHEMMMTCREGMMRGQITRERIYNSRRHSTEKAIPDAK